MPLALSSTATSDDVISFSKAFAATDDADLLASAAA